MGFSHLEKQSTNQLTIQEPEIKILAIDMAIPSDSNATKKEYEKYQGPKETKRPN